MQADEWPKYHSEALMRAAINFQKSGRLAVSKQLFEQAFHLQKTLLEKKLVDPLSPISTLSWLGVNTANQGRMNDAAALIRAALSFMPLSGDATWPPSMWDTVARLALANLRLGEVAMAHSLFNYAFTMAKAHFGEADPRLADLLLVKARIEQKENPARAIECAEQALNLKRTMSPEQHIEAQALIFKTLLLTKQLPRAKKFIEEYKREVVAKASPLIVEHLQAALCEYEGLYQLETRELKPAIESLQNSLDLKLRVFGKDSFEEAVATYQLAFAMEQEKLAREEEMKKEDAASLGPVAVPATPLAVPVPAAETVTPPVVLAAVKGATKSETAFAHTEKVVLEHYDRAVEIFQQRLGDTHPETRALITKTAPTLVSIPLECLVL
jgi:tetratricopeptide (TPR) repeat protein